MTSDPRGKEGVTAKDPEEVFALQGECVALPCTLRGPTGTGVVSLIKQQWVRVQSLQQRNSSRLRQPRSLALIKGLGRSATQSPGGRVIAANP